MSTGSQGRGLVGWGGAEHNGRETGERARRARGTLAGQLIAPASEAAATVCAHDYLRRRVSAAVSDDGGFCVRVVYDRVDAATERGASPEER